MNKFVGTPTEFGTFLARKFADRNHNFDVDINRRTFNRQLKLYRKFWPELLEESKSVADFLGLPEDGIIYDEVASFVDGRKHHVGEVRKVSGFENRACTIFAIHENGKTFVGRNYDWHPSARNYFQIYDLKVGSAYRFLAFSDEGVYPGHYGHRSWKFYAEDAINEHGLYIGLTASDLREKYYGYGFSSYHIIRYIAEHCKTTREALMVFRKIPVAVPKNFLIADKVGDIAVIEHAARDYDILRPKSVMEAKYIVHTNHCLGPKYMKVDPVLEVDSKTDSFLRHAEADFMIRKELPGYQFTDLRRVLRDSHYVYNKDTIWSLALELSEPRFTYYYDTAQGQKEQSFRFD